MKEKLLKIIEHYPLNNQLKKFSEESYELIEAILCGDGTYHIAEEIADVQVMLGQFKEWFGISDEQIAGIMSFKIDRQLERIKNEK